MRRGLLIPTLLSTFALPAQTIPGSINAHVISVYEGDAFTVDAMPWPGVTIRTDLHGKSGPG